MKRQLKIFDFDDTLAKSETPVIIKKSDGTSIKLTPGEFATYKMDPSDKMDFTFFNKMIKKAEPIQHNVNLLKKYLSNPGKYKVTILTARALAFPIRYWLKKLTGQEVYVVGVAGSDPKLKADYIEKEIKKGYTDIFFMDDSLPNVTAIKNLETKYPDVKINAIVAEEYFLNKINTITEDLRDWFGKGGKGGVGGGGWDRYNSKGERVGKCGDAKEGDAYSACLSKEKARKLGKKGRAAFVNRKRGAQKKAGDAKKGGERTKGQKPVKVKTGASESVITEKNVPTNPSKWAYYKSQAKKKFDVYPSAYANAWAAKMYKKAGGGWRTEK